MEYFVKEELRRASRRQRRSTWGLMTDSNKVREPMMSISGYDKVEESQAENDKLTDSLQKQVARCFCDHLEKGLLNKDLTEKMENLLKGFEEAVQQRMKQESRSVLKGYGKGMEVVVNSNDFMSEPELEREHALEKVMSGDLPENANQFLVELEQDLAAEFEKLKEANSGNREQAFEKGYRLVGKSCRAVEAALEREEFEQKERKKELWPVWPGAQVFCQSDAFQWNMSALFYCLGKIFLLN